MQNIERYGVVALVFLVVTVGAVLIWNHRGKDQDPNRNPAVELAAKEASNPPAPAPGPERGDANDPSRVTLRAEPSGRALRREAPVATPSSASTEGLPAARTTTGGVGTVAPDPLTNDATLTASIPATVDGSPPQGPVQEPAPAEPKKAANSYVIRSSDTLSEIAQRELGTSKRWLEIVALNPGLDPARLQTGKRILLPEKRASATSAGPEAKRLLAAPTEPKKAASGKASRTYRVASGDSLWKIAARTLGDGNRWKEIADLNPKVRPDRLVEGQVLVLPAGSSAEGPKVAVAVQSDRVASRPSSGRKEGKVR